MSGIPGALRSRVIERADDCCEYCGIAQSGQEAVFHVDHILPRVAGGDTVIENLALACVSCSLRKGARTKSADPDSGESTPLFHPRLMRWSEHFRAQDEWLMGETATGRATVELLRMNRPVARAIRAAIRQDGGAV
jgi:hypothetical protein